MYLGFFVQVTLKAPAFPSTLSTRVSQDLNVRMPSNLDELRCEYQMEQSLVGKVLSSCAMWPPIAGALPQVHLETRSRQVQ